MKSDIEYCGIKSVFTVYFQNQIVSTIDIDHGTSKTKYTIGRSPENDIVINSPIVSVKHAELEISDGFFVIRDLNSTNGIYVNGNKTNSAVLMNGDIIRIDNINNPNENGILIMYSLVENDCDEKWNEIDLNNLEEVAIGRKSDNDLVIFHSLVSKQHAKIKVYSNRVTIEDLNSTNGTYVNGNLLIKSQILKEFDNIIIGNTKIIYQDNKLIYNTLSKGLKLDAIHISKVISDSNGSGKKKILDDISISIKAGELVALIGGSGAGKSTFMDSLNGFRLPTEGSVFVNDDDFYRNYYSYKNIIGYVPQQDIVYDTLTVRDMLTYAARLRMPEDSTKSEIEERVNQVLTDVELDGREDVYIKQLSGGQKKRASIAVELLADPKLFFLDEPTSGLDPGMERNLMKLLRKLADTGKTIILITHATANLHLCDKAVILGYGGKLCYFGPPKGALEFFNVEEYADIYDLINKESKVWQERFRNSKYFMYYKPLVEKEIKRSKTKNREKVKRSSIKQFFILAQRYLKLTVLDKQRFAFIILQAPLIAFLLSMVADKDSFKYFESSQQIIFTLACSAVWIGVLNSIQEICKERPIYKRERAVNLKLIPYIFSKLTILGFICLVQAGLLVVVFSALINQPKIHLLATLNLEIFITVFITIFTSTTMGLCVSTLVSNTDRAMGLAPIILIPQLLFTGLVFQLKGFSDKIADLAISKWASRALAVSFDLNGRPLKSQVEYPKLPTPPRDLPSFYNHDINMLYQNWIVLGVIILICLILNLVLLERND
ncbi:ABC transporter ATP-binding/permease protein [Clostridium pasteurianum DSM 525 = ATCC 6013]|uniref:ABC transporter ATP-binding/permease protein n=1 Tax=Clostridium pasteurianum DSM 525 = ATCC 6013 TaxID=1262449 RepID=A0A0H3IZ46_CLOPA|nr:FHA domain-containing protein [Clostridium pasteurianum]AJA46791.1 ABC transporter ATP-binding/permease protein [Clostridium pasteurianum DSM 525 = ATCC 6013]AJA50779.1 ABC transporter ATP-binding/permease protein [Clostridium pasteurianum DSM 525 = ATCC 6013]AOZ74185.1 ABC transporter permease [Clostridium pasteurianum DSM 525 = ATCC 6013]AOZ77983.1 ABC transporter permease [Clostridium pasteurianum]ELP58598.1 FHA modulated ABC efflux pump with fused ATPase and integral membrane subunits [